MSDEARPDRKGGIWEAETIYSGLTSCLLSLTRVLLLFPLIILFPTFCFLFAEPHNDYLKFFAAFLVGSASLCVLLTTKDFTRWNNWAVHKRAIMAIAAVVIVAVIDGVIFIAWLLALLSVECPGLAECF